MEALLERLAETVSANAWLAPVSALFAGVLASLMPCSLPSIPLIIAYVGGTAERNGRKALLLSLVFALGSAVSFVIMALIAVSAGKLLGIYSRGWLIFLALLMFAMAFQTWGIANFIPSLNLISKSRLTGCAGAFAAGILAGIFSSPCSTPVLIALLSVIAAEGSIVRGTVLMLFYALGHGFLAVLAGTSLGFVQKLSASSRYETFSKLFSCAAGFVILITGIYILYLAF